MSNSNPAGKKVPRVKSDDPPFFPDGTQVSARYKGAYCSAVIQNTVKLVRCKVIFIGSDPTKYLVTDDLIEGPLQQGAIVKAKLLENTEPKLATILQVRDGSTYTVEFDDGDVSVLTRAKVLPKGDLHFKPQDSLNQNPLINPDHFANPVVNKSPPPPVTPSASAATTADNTSAPNEVVEPGPSGTAEAAEAADPTEARRTTSKKPKPKRGNKRGRKKKTTTPKRKANKDESKHSGPLPTDPAIASDPKAGTNSDHEDAVSNKNSAEQDASSHSRSSSSSCSCSSCSRYCCSGSCCSSSSSCSSSSHSCCLSAGSLASSLSSTSSCKSSSPTSSTSGSSAATPAPPPQPPAGVPMNTSNSVSGDDADVEMAQPEPTAQSSSLDVLLAAANTERRKINGNSAAAEPTDNCRRNGEEGNSKSVVSRKEQSSVLVRSVRAGSSAKKPVEADKSLTNTGEEKERIQSGSCKHAQKCKHGGRKGKGVKNNSSASTTDAISASTSRQAHSEASTPSKSKVSRNANSSTDPNHGSSSSSVRQLRSNSNKSVSVPPSEEPFDKQYERISQAVEDKKYRTPDLSQPPPICRRFNLIPSLNGVTDRNERLALIKESLLKTVKQYSVTFEKVDNGMPKTKKKKTKK